jgi:carboxyl-terminal processing protease
MNLLSITKLHRTPARPVPHSIIRLLLVVPMLLVLLAGTAAAKSEELLTCERVPELARTYLHKHISVHYVNDQLRKRVIETYIKRLDPSKNLFLSSEVNELRKQMQSVFQEVREGNCSDLNKIHKDLVKRYGSMEKYVRKLLESESYALDPDSMLIIDPAQRAHPKDDAMREDLLTKLVHFQMSNYLSSDMEMPEAKEKLIHRYELMTRRTRERTRQDIYASYLDSFANALDPHSNYLSKEVLEDFQIAMGLSLDGIGVALSSRDGYSVVEKIIPGGAADSLDILIPKDKIISVAQEEGEVVDIIDMELRDVVRLIRGERGTTVHLTILRQTESTERFRVSIVRDKINLEDQAAKLRFEQVDIKGKNEKLAILELPSFYGGRGPGERQSSRDLEKLLGEVKKEKAAGLVLDLSRNGGGLLDNSITIAGFFIKEGGVVAVKDTFSKTQVMEDNDSRIVYDGPMVVLASRVSASASEIVAGAMKDYQRAVIVGDDHTFGKGTVQSMVQLQEGLGALKVTTAMFFRPGGKSTQNAGVESDIVLPPSFSIKDFGESHQTYALPTQVIPSYIEDANRPSGSASKSTAPWAPITAEIVAELSKRSAIRVANNEDFSKLQEKIAKSEQRNGVVHLAELMKENAEEDAKNGDEEDDAEAPAQVDGEEGVKKDEPTPQQQEAVQILADLVELLG